METLTKPQVEGKTSNRRTLDKIIGWRLHELNNPLSILIETSEMLQEERIGKTCIDIREAVKGYLKSNDQATLGEYVGSIKEKLYSIDSSVGSMPDNELSSILKEGYFGARTAVEKLESEDYASESVYGILDSLSNVTFDDAKNIKLEKNLSKDIRNLNVSVASIENIYSVLVNNALDAMEKGGKLSIGGYIENDNLVLKVKDTGKGIPKSVLSKIGGLGVTYGKGEKGTGFGIYSLVEDLSNYGGKLAVQSEEGIGTEVTVTIPVSSLEHATGHAEKKLGSIEEKLAGEASYKNEDLGPIYSLVSAGEVI